MAHLVGIFTAGAGKELFFTDQQIIDLYTEIGGFDPKQTQPDGSNPTDQGCDEDTAMNFWKSKGAPIGQYPITGSLKINASDPEEVRQAIWLFENVFFGVELPDAWVNPFPSGNNFKWDVAGTPDPDNGHAFCGCGYSPRGVVIGTWGMAGLITDKAVEYYASQDQGGALYTVLSPSIINKAKQKSPNGFDWTQISADFQAIGGSIT